MVYGCSTETRRSLEPKQPNPRVVGVIGLVEKKRLARLYAKRKEKMRDYRKMIEGAFSRVLMSLQHWSGGSGNMSDGWVINWRMKRLSENTVYPGDGREVLTIVGI